MKIFKYISKLLAFALFATISMTSCDDDKIEKEKEDEKGIAIKTVKAISCVDLSDRSDWIFIVMYNQYDYSIDGNNIEAKVNKTPYYFSPSHPLGSYAPIGGGPVIRLVSPDYNSKETRSVGPTPPNISDQTTFEKFMRADVLSTYYSGEVSENIVDVRLTHANALLEFDFEDIPSNAEVRVQSLVTINPFKNENNYKAIVLAEGGEFSAYILVKIGNEVLDVAVPVGNSTKSSPLPSGNSIMRDTRYKFTVKYNATKKALSIKNLHRTKWSETYPIDLTLAGKEITEFKLYIGSPDGPKEISTNNLNPIRFWGTRLSQHPSKITFDNDETISLTPNDTDADSFKYRFDENTLFRHNENTNTWICAGLGDMYKLNYNMGYFRARYHDTETGVNKFYIGQKNETVSEKGFLGDAYSLDNLKQETDTIMWCNVQYIYTSNIWDY